MKRYFAPLSAAAFGVICAVFNYMDRAHGFDTLELPVPGSIWPLLLYISLALGAVLAFVGAYRWTAPAVRQNYEDLFGGDSTMLKLVSVIGGLIFLLGGAGIAWVLYQTGEFSTALLPQIVLVALSLIACVACFNLTRAQAHGQMSAGIASSTVLLLLWAAFNLIVVFKDNNINPFLSRYLPDLLGGIGLTLGFMLQAQLLYGKPRPRAFLFCAAIGIMSVFSAAGGAALAILLPANLRPSSIEMMQLTAQMGGAVFLLGQMIRMCAPRNQIYKWQDKAE